MTTGWFCGCKFVNEPQRADQETMRRRVQTTEQVEEWVRENKTKTACKYGAECYRQGNAEHIAEFSHPEKEKRREKEEVRVLAGKTVVFTGTLTMTRAIATAKVVGAGAKITSAVSGATNVLVAGAGSGAKLEEAKGRGIEVWTEAEFDAAVDAVSSASKRIKK